MLHIVLLETALELVPHEISAKKDIQKHAYRRKKRPNELLLDQSYHGQAMTKLKDGDRRGRPDILYFCLQSVLETPLCKEGLLSLHIHLYDGRIIEVNPEVRVPRNYERFVGLMEQLLLTGQVPPEGQPFLRISNKTLQSLVSELTSSHDESLSLLAVEGGRHTSLQSMVDLLPSSTQIPVVVGIGAFPHGDFHSDARSLFKMHIELDVEVMMAWHVCTEVLWCYSLKHDIIAKRYSDRELGA